MKAFLKKTPVWLLTIYMLLFFLVYGFMATAIGVMGIIEGLFRHGLVSGILLLFLIPMMVIEAVIWLIYYGMLMLWLVALPLQLKHRQENAPPSQMIRATQGIKHVFSGMYFSVFIYAVVLILNLPYRCFREFPVTGLEWLRGL